VGVLSGDGCLESREEPAALSQDVRFRGRWCFMVLLHVSHGALLATPVDTPIALAIARRLTPFSHSSHTYSESTNRRG
jgi:hypothetical protein